MKLTRVVRLFTLTLLIGGSALMYSQDERDAKPPQDEARPEATKPGNPPKQQEDTKPAKPAEPAARPNDSSPAHNGASPKDVKPQAQAPAQQPGHNAQMAQRGQGHIPDDKFRANFGRSHTVVIHQPVIVEGQPRFQFGGYWFAMVDPWPVGWAYTDDCYIDFVDGEYVLFDLLHPGVSVALIVVT
jgi:hypothetical protein